jgi:hypothetical protein
LPQTLPHNDGPLNDSKRWKKMNLPTLRLKLSATHYNTFAAQKR